MLKVTTKKTVQRYISKDTSDKAKWNSKICSSNSQEVRRKKTEKDEKNTQKPHNIKNRKQKVK